MYIRRVFEANSDEDSDFNMCKTIIETLREFEEEVEVSQYKEGYYDKGQSELEKRSRGDNSKKAIRFVLKVKDFDGIENKSGFDKTIFLLQRSKTLYGKFSNYCKNLIIQIDGDNRVEFTLPFENDDNNEKVTSRVKRMMELTWKWFNEKDSYKQSKTFYLIKEKEKKEYYRGHEYTPDVVQPILDEIKKNRGPFGENYSKVINNPVDEFDKEYKFPSQYPTITFRFTVNIINDGNKIILTPTTYRWETYDIKWRKMKSNKEVDNLVIKLATENLLNWYYFKKDDIEKTNFEIKDGKSIITIS